MEFSGLYGQNWRTSILQMTWLSCLTLSSRCKGRPTMWRQPLHTLDVHPQGEDKGPESEYGQHSPHQVGRAGLGRSTSLHLLGQCSRQARWYRRRCKSKNRQGKARAVFVQLKNIWTSKELSLKTKVRQFNTNVKSVLLYGSETCGQQ